MFSCMVVVAVSFITSCVKQEGYEPMADVVSSSREESSDNLRLVAGFGFNQVDTKSVLTNYASFDSYYENWLMVIYKSSGEQVKEVRGIGSDGDMHTSYYPAFHCKSNGYDTNDLGSYYDNTPFGWGYVYDNDGTGRQYYNVYVLLNVPISDYETLCGLFPDYIEDFDDFESNFNISIDSFNYFGETGYAAIKEAEKVFGCSITHNVRTEDYLTLALPLFNTFTLTINDEDRGALGNMNMDRSRICNLPLNIKPFSANYVDQTGISDDDTYSLSFHDILDDSEVGYVGAYGKSVSFLLPESRPGSSSYVSSSSQRSRNFLVENGETGLANSAIYVEAVFNLDDSWRFDNSSTLTLRGYPQNSGSSVNNFNIIANQTSSLTWNVDYDYIKNSDDWLVELFGSENHLRCYWYDDDSIDTGEVREIADGDWVPLAYDNYLCAWDDMEVHLRAIGDDSFDWHTTIGELGDSDFPMYTGIAYADMFSFNCYGNYIEIMLEDMSPYTYYFDTNTYFELELVDPVTGDSCSCLFAPEDYTTAPRITNVHSGYVGQQIYLTSDRSADWSVIRGNASLTSTSNVSSTYINLNGAGNVTVRLYEHNDHSSYRDETIYVYNPVLQLSKDGENYTSRTGDLNLYIDKKNYSLYYRYVDNNGNQLTSMQYGATLSGGCLALNLSGTGWLYNNGFVYEYSINSSSYSSSGNVLLRKRLYYSSYNIMDFYNGHVNDPTTLYIVPSYVGSFDSYNSGCGQKDLYMLGVNFVHPLSSYRLNSGVYSNSNVIKITGLQADNKFYLTRSSDYYPVKFNKSLDLNIANNGGCSIYAKEGGSSYSISATKTYVKEGLYRFEDMCFYDGVDCGSYNLSFVFGDGSDELTIESGTNAASTSSFVFTSYLNIGIGMKFNISSDYSFFIPIPYSSIDRYVFFKPEYINIRNSDYVGNLFSCHPITVFSDDALSVFNRFSGTSSYISDVFNNNAVNDMDNHYAINYSKLWDDYTTYFVDLDCIINPFSIYDNSVYVNGNYFWSRKATSWYYGSLGPTAGYVIPSLLFPQFTINYNWTSASVNGYSDYVKLVNLMPENYVSDSSVFDAWRKLIGGSPYYYAP